MLWTVTSLTDFCLQLVCQQLEQIDGFGQYKREFLTAVTD